MWHSTLYSTILTFSRSKVYLAFLIFHLQLLLFLFSAISLIFPIIIILLISLFSSLVKFCDFLFWVLKLMTLKTRCSRLFLSLAMEFLFTLELTVFISTLFLLIWLWLRWFWLISTICRRKCSPSATYFFLEFSICWQICFWIWT